MFYDNVAAAENDCEEEVTTCRVVTSQDQDNLLCNWARGGCWLAGARWTEDEIANVQYWPHLKLDSV